MPKPPSDVLWQRKDVMLVAAGSGPCLRELYYRAVEQGKLQQLMFCHTTDDDYTMGTAEEKITRVIKRAAAVHGVQVVVLYLNCLDILTRLDFDYLESSLSEVTGVMVRYFFRGPLGKMDIRHFKPVYEFMAELPEENGCISHNLYQLPPLATDVAGVIDTLPANEAKVLVAPSGCRACLRDGDLLEQTQGVYVLETKKQDFIYGIEDNCVKQCSELMSDGKYKSLNLISSAVAAFIGFDGNWVANSMENNLKIRSFDMDGFNDAVYGVSCAQELLMEEEQELYIVVMGRAPHLGVFTKPKQKDYELTDEVLTDLGIYHLRNRSFNTLSGGQQRQAVIARAIVQQPQLVIMDEPTNHLDYGNQFRVLQMVQKLSQKGIAVILTTHMPDQAFYLGSKTAILKPDGLEVGDVRDVLTESALEEIYKLKIKLLYLPEQQRTICVPY